jgi:dienelactone hydrolase
MTAVTPVTISLGASVLAADLALPEPAHGLVVFAHGSGSGRQSPRNRSVARVLHERRLATLLVDLLTPVEEAADLRTRELRFDIHLLAERLVRILEWSRDDPRTARLRSGVFGASTGGGAALVAAADEPKAIGAVVSRGGRPDLAGDALARVAAPTLLIVGGEDDVVLGLNRQALEEIPAEKRLEVIPGATHLFEEPGALEQVASLASDWFRRHLSHGDR